MAGSMACRHTSRLLADLAAEYGEIEVIHDRIAATPDERDAIANRDGMPVGGAGAWVRNPDGRVLLVPGEDGWLEPGRTLRPSEDPIECAIRAVAECAGLEPTVTGLARVHVRHLDDWTDRPPVPQPFVVFLARATGDPVGEARWHGNVPDQLLYDSLREAFDQA